MVSWCEFGINDVSKFSFTPCYLNHLALLFFKKESHNHCLSVCCPQTVVSCPLETLCSHVVAEQPSNQELTNSAATWLSWLHPEVFKTHEGR